MREKADPFYIFFDSVGINMYNIFDKSIISQSYLKVRLMKHAKRHQKYTFFLREQRFNPLRRIVSNSRFLQKDQAQVALAELYKIVPKEPKLSNGRVYFTFDLRNNLRYRPYRKHSLFTNQRCLQKDNWHKNIAQHNSNKAFSIQAYSKDNPPDCQGAQYNPEENISQAAHKDKRYI
jgi:hypothetical protein